MDNERILLINALSKTCTRELTDQLQHYKDVFQINPQLEIIDSDIVKKKFFKVINEHLTIRRAILDHDSAWSAKSK